MKRNKPIRILHVIGGMDRGGAESLVMNIIRNIDRNKYVITLLCFSNYAEGKTRYAYQDDLEKLNIKLIKIEDNRFRNPIGFVRNVYRVIKKEETDIVHSHVDMMSAFSLTAAKLANVKVRIAHSHNTSNPRLNNIFSKFIGWLLRRIVRIVATCRFACGTDAGRFLFGKKPFIVIQNGIDLSKYKFNTKYRNELRKHYNISANAKIALNVGRLAYQKNQSFLIDIFSKYLEADKEAKLFIIGDGDDHDALADQIKKLGIEKSIFLISSRDDVNKYYSMADLFVMTSHFEGLPFVSVEAQASGLPCLFSNTIAKESALTDSVEFFPLTSSVNAWSKELGKSLAKGRYDQNYNVLLDTEYNISNMIKKTEELYAELYDATH